MWKTQVGNFYAPPVLAGGVIYGIADRRPPSAPNVIAVRISDGKLLWRTPVPNSDNASYVAADASNVALLTHSSGLYGLDPATGTQRWHIPGIGGPGLVVHKGVVFTTLATAPIPGLPASQGAQLTLPTPPPTPTPPSTGGPSSPWTALLVAVKASDGAPLWQAPFDLDVQRLVVNDRAVYGTVTGGVLFAFDTHTGKPLTTTSQGGVGSPDTTAFSQGWVMTASERIVLVSDNQPNAPHLRALSATDGTVLWDVPVEFGLSASVPARVQIAGDFIYSVDGNNNITAVRVSNGSVAWQRHFGQYDPSTLVVRGSVVFTMLAPFIPDIGPCLIDCTPSIVSLDAATGAVYWQRDVEGADYLAMFAQ
jgi:outer membrane protein assembly factor BamB